MLKIDYPGIRYYNYKSADLNTNYLNDYETLIYLHTRNKEANLWNNLRNKAATTVTHTGVGINKIGNKFLDLGRRLFPGHNTQAGIQKPSKANLITPEQTIQAQQTQSTVAQNKKITKQNTNKEQVEKDTENIDPSFNEQNVKPKGWGDMADDAKQSVMNFFESDTFKNNAGKWIAGAAAVPVVTGIGGMGVGYLMAPSPRRHRND